MLPTEEALSQALDVAKQLKLDNEQWKTAYQAVRENLEKSQRDLVEAQQSRARTESKCRSLLRSQAEEFKQVMEDMVPAWKSKLQRVSVLQEIESEHQEKIMQLEEEVQKWCALYNNEKSERAVMSSQFHQMQLNYQQQLKDEQTKLSAKIHELSTKNQKMQSILDDTTLADKLRQIERENTDLRLKQQMVIEEVEDYKNRCAQVGVEREALKANHLQQVKAIERDRLVLTKEVESGKRSNQDLQRELALHKEVQITVEKKGRKLEKENTSLTSKLQVKDRQIKTLESKLQTSVKAITQEFESQIAVLDHQIADLTTAENRVKEELMRVKEKSARELASKETEIANQAAEHTKNLSKLNEEKTKIIEELESLRVTSLNIENQLGKEQEALMNELEGERKTVLKVTGEYKEMKLKLEQVEGELKESRENERRTRNEYDDVFEEFSKLQRYHRKNIQEFNEKETQIISLRLQLNKSEEAAAQAERYRIDCEELAKTMRSMKEVQAKKLDNLKGERNKYKKLVALAKMKLSSLKKELHQREQDYGMQLSSVEKRLLESERQKNEIKNSLTMDSQSVDLNELLEDTDAIDSILARVSR